jgi:hypothetical protein
MAPLPSPVTYRVVLVPSDQVTEDGCKPGFVGLLGTPGEGEWEYWGPYRCVGEVTAESAALGFGVPLPGGGPVPGVPSAS